MKILNELFYGNISGAGLKTSEKYKKACKKELEIYDKLKSTLNKEQDKLLEELLTANTNCIAICEKDIFIYAFKVGLNIGIESSNLKFNN